MAVIAATDLVYTVRPSSAKVISSRRDTVFNVAFGNGVDTYPAGGIPLLRGSLGCPTTIESFNFMDTGAGSSNVYKYDAANEKVRIYVAGTELGAVAVAATNLLVQAVGW